MLQGLCTIRVRRLDPMRPGRFDYSRKQVYKYISVKLHEVKGTPAMLVEKLHRLLAD